MNAIVGNTGGDNRVEFDMRAPHAIWYETPRFLGLQLNVMYSPGQNLADDDSNFAQGESLCSGASEHSSGSGQAGVSISPVGGYFGNTPGQNTTAGSGFGECNDGGAGDVMSAGATFRHAGLVAIASTEHHLSVNRVSDEAPPAPPAGAVGVHEEHAMKVGAGYDFGPLKVYGMFEALRRVGTNAHYNERSREGWYASVTWRFLKDTDAMAHYARATRTPGDPAVIPNGDNAADLVSVGLRHHFARGVSAYVVGALDHNHSTGHYGLGQSGHGVPILARDQFNEGFHLPNALLGRTIRAVSVGATYTF
jgi:predicted porin